MNVGVPTLVPTLVDITVDAIARLLPLPVAPSPATLPDETLVQRIYTQYMRLDQARRLANVITNLHSPVRHLAALRQFAALWQPSVLLLDAPAGGQARICSCHELQAFAASLSHLELSTRAAWVSGLSCLTHLQCLSLRTCTNLTTAALQDVLQGLPQLSALDLCGLTAATDVLAPTIMALTRLRVLQLNRTSCGDVTVDCLTYGARLHDWSTCQHQQQQHQQQQQQQHPEDHAASALHAAAPPLTSQSAPAAATAAGGGGSGAPLAGDPQLYPQLQQQRWPRTRITAWHLAHTRVSPRTAELLASCEQLHFVDLRGSGVRAEQLRTLRSRHGLSSPQGAVLARTSAMVLAATTYEQFVCAEPAEHAAAAADTHCVTRDHAAGFPCASPQQWVNAGVQALLQAAEEAGLASRAIPS